MSEHVRFITIDDQIIYQGDYVSAIITTGCTNDESETFDDTSYVIGRIHISEKVDDDSTVIVHICQNQYDGASIENKYGYLFSWHALVNTITGEVITDDTYSLKKATYEQVVEHIKKNNQYLRNGEVPELILQEDDDPMPSDWKYDDKLPF